MAIVIIESPFAAETPEDMLRNYVYLQRCIRDAVLYGEQPYASHMLMTLALDDRDTHERNLGISTTIPFLSIASCVAFYTDYGWSPGMVHGQTAAHAEQRRRNSLGISERRIGTNEKAMSECMAILERMGRFAYDQFKHGDSV